MCTDGRTDGRTDRHSSNVLEFCADQMSPRNIGSQIIISRCYTIARPYSIYVSCQILYCIQPEMSLIAEDNFSIKIRIIFKLLLSLINEHSTLLVVKRLQFLRQVECKNVDQDHFSKFATTMSHVTRRRYENILYCAGGFKFFSTRRSIVDLLGRLLRRS